MVIGVDPAGVLGAIFEGGEGALAEEEAVHQVGRAEVFVIVEARQDCSVVRELEELAGDDVGGGVAELDAGIGAEIVEARLDRRLREGLQEASGGGDVGWGAVRVEGAIDEEELGHVARILWGHPSPFFLRKVFEKGELSLDFGCVRS